VCGLWDDCRVGKVAPTRFTYRRTQQQVPQQQLGCGRCREELNIPLCLLALRHCCAGLQGDTAKAGRLGFVAGLIPQEKLNGFERLLFRWVGE
jgi:hypothetical protein